MDFENAKTTYRKNAFVQENMAQKLIFILAEKLGKNFDKILEIGAGTGFLTDEIAKNLKYDELILNDITENYTKTTPDKYIQGDILEVEVPDSLNLILSNACFQWILDYDFLFKKLRTRLIDGGHLAFTYFGSKNFIQIKNITGIGLHYPDLKNVILNSGFEILYFEQNLETMYFKSAQEVLRHIKFTGVKTKNKIWTKTDLLNFIEKYKAKYRDDMGYALTYHPQFYILRAI